MAQSSGPTSIGTDTEKQFSDAIWRSRFGDEAGVLCDMDGTAYQLIVTGADTCTIGSSTQDSLATVAGFAHRIPQGNPESVTIPAAVGATRTDLICLRYDPTWGGALGPVRLTLVTGTSSAIPSYDAAPGGIEELPLFAVTRAVGQTLSQAIVQRLYPRIAPSLEIPATAPQPTSSPLGTLLWHGVTEYRRALNNIGVPAWVTRIQPGADVAFTSFPSANGWTVRTAASCGYEVVGRWVCVNINFSRSSWSDDQLIATLPIGARPARPRFYPGNWNGVIKTEVRIETDGRIIATNADTVGLIGTFSFPAA